ncbi:hypothetical protein T4A_5624 [Trichinella pseudospiralis]|uniref:Uncharacterized protein n=1 Tax=Trichinella pseudospiralis TaxID=6337 RepID=A0A0V1DKT6_TRIPS|nr:hypothetical protein T4A_5624 [Trichinella pseudospiralis]
MGNLVRNTMNISRGLLVAECELWMLFIPQLLNYFR